LIYVSGNSVRLPGTAGQATSALWAKAGIGGAGCPVPAPYTDVWSGIPMLNLPVREKRLSAGGPEELTIMFYERRYTSLGEKIATVIGLFVLVAALSALLVGAHIIAHIA
jgi:hypothetical protein